MQSENLANSHSEHNDLPELLAQVPCTATTYDDWLRIGMGLKYEGYPLEVWSSWSATDPDRYNIREIEAKWNGFGNSSAKSATGATVAYICRQYGAQQPQRNAGSMPARPATQQPAPEQTEEPKPDYTEGRKQHAAYIDKCEAAMVEGCAGWTYLTGRGLTPDTIKRHRLGYDEQRRAVVMPYSDKPDEYYHIDRLVDVDTHTRHKYDKPPTREPNKRGDLPVGEEPVFFASDLMHGTVVFVVEGAMDAYALHQLGYQAAGVISAHAYGNVVETLKQAGYQGTVVVMLDDDKTGNKAATGLCAALKEAGIKYVRGKQTPGTNDASEALETCPDHLKAHLQTAYAQATGGVYDPTVVLDGILQLVDEEEPIPTGLPALDTALDGGLRRGVVVLGALSSLGKTTLMLQIADNIAEAGRPVLFVSIEQSAKEVVSKSLVRLMASTGKPEGKTNTNDLNSSRKRAAWSKERRAIMAEAAERYREKIATNLCILQASDRPSASYIMKHAQAIADKTGTPPIVFVDYLQLMAPANERDTDKMTADNNMRELRQMARDLATTVFVVSSISRNSYTGDLSMAAFKESGGIEYSADVALGLQVYDIKHKLMYEGKGGIMKYLQGEAKKEKATEIYENVKKRPTRHLEIKVLKNRNGAMPDRAVRAVFHAEECRFTVEDCKPKTKKSKQPPLL